MITGISHRQDALFDGTPARCDVIDQGRDHRLRVGARQIGEQDDPDPGVGQRIAMDVAGERVVDRLNRAHSRSP